MLTRQDALLTLARYWAGQGCMIVQPMNTEVGAGTLNPATALRVLGPEPWRVGYAEPSVRPDDSRYGDNPNRLQTHTQFQVILTRMRNLAHGVAELWVQRRAELGYPLGTATAPAVAPEHAAVTGPAAAPEPAPASARGAGVAADLAFEIGAEELPPAEVTRAADAARVSLAGKLAATRLRHGAITVLSSPRRIAAIVSDVQPYEDDEEQAIRGPRLSAAYDADGSPTKAAIGFARGHGIDVTSLRPVTVNGGSYAGFVRHTPGRPAAVVLAGLLPAMLTELRAERNMRWNAQGLAYSRPIRWALALLGEDPVRFSAAGLTSGRATRVHRSAPEPVVDVRSAAGYLRTLRAHGIEPDASRRRARILAAAAELAAAAGGQVDPGGEHAVTAEVTNLVEDPVAILGSFDARYLDLPADILTTVMKKHQRYLPVRSATGRLQPRFITIANGECDRDLVRAGNEAVLRARYEDAAFFWRSDLARSPAELRNRLGKLTFETRLGSVADRADRIAAIAAAVADRIDLPGGDRAVLQRAAELGKFDLGSDMVAELPGLAGHGRPANPRRRGGLHRPPLRAADDRSGTSGRQRPRRPAACRHASAGRANAGAAGRTAADRGRQRACGRHPADPPHCPGGHTSRFDQALFDSPAEHGLAAALGKTSEAAGQDAGLSEFAAAATITGPVSDFFDQVLVMADDPAVRANRLGLLASVYQLAARYLDWAQLS